MLKVIEKKEKTNIPIEALPSGAVGRVTSEGYDRDALIVRDTAGEYVVLGRTNKGKVRCIPMPCDGLSVEMLKAGTVIEVDYTGVNGL